jgi:hypothetical protein
MWHQARFQKLRVVYHSIWIFLLVQLSNSIQFEDNYHRTEMCPTNYEDLLIDINRRKESNSKKTCNNAHFALIIQIIIFGKEKRRIEVHLYISHLFFSLLHLHQSTMILTKYSNSIIKDSHTS